MSRYGAVLGRSLLVAGLSLVALGNPATASEEAAFQFGSYGRLSASSNTSGGRGKRVSVVRYSPRLLEGAYTELDFGYEQRTGTGAVFDTHLTLALGESLFHYDGNFDSEVAIRNLYLEVQDAGTKGLSLWMGSRMKRGDDVYLLDFWPLDEQNTLGGGIAYRFGGSRIGAHVGVNQLDDGYQTQRVVVREEPMGTREVQSLERQRSVGSLRAEHQITLTSRYGLKVVGYGEVHFLPSGIWLEADQDPVELPEEFGTLVGFQVGVFRRGGGNFMNLFLKMGQDLGAWDELAVPFEPRAERRALGAKEFLTALSANVENGRLGLMGGACVRYFVDSDSNVFDVDDRLEASASLRPVMFLSDHLRLGAELNLQYSRPNGVSWETGAHEIPRVWQAALIPAWALGKGSYTRPELRLVAAVTGLNGAARLTYAPEDPARELPYQYYVGLGVEWWFNSSRY